MDWERYYKAAIKMTDLYGKRFCDMMASDFRASEAERDYFTGEFREIELFGWAEFGERITADHQEKWLKKIMALDEAVMMNLLESRLMEAMEGKLSDNNSRVIDKDALDATVKALQGLVGRAKILSEQTDTEEKVPEVLVQFIGSAGDGVTDRGTKTEAELKALKKGVDIDQTKTEM